MMVDPYRDTSRQHKILDKKRKADGSPSAFTVPTAEPPEEIAAQHAAFNSCGLWLQKQDDVRVD